MSQSILEYFDALERLIKNAPRVVPKNTKISNDSVAIEAGRKRGSIKRSRAMFSVLISAIDQAATNQNCCVQKSPGDVLKERNKKIKEEYGQLREQYEYLVSENIKMLVVIAELKKELAQFRGGNVIPLFLPKE
ncbi:MULTISPECIES: hypothetical protein [Deefgea]|uniref:Uncharacterized protein n=1 Tax=Deefgea chitinilytica TaxID=570276 RepID=A0ABS2C8T0_9NEIS|nr:MULTISPECIES: hypothetical protein [Deefgea]MBM5570553.1 hypothetical protein [Deefgea chitinilytica]MBM9887782.1 hypothetical protein [Deefgea sp. CFH1-16]